MLLIMSSVRSVGAIILLPSYPMATVGFTFKKKMPLPSSLSVFKEDSGESFCRRTAQAFYPSQPAVVDPSQEIYSQARKVAIHSHFHSPEQGRRNFPIPARTPKKKNNGIPIFRPARNVNPCASNHPERPTPFTGAGAPEWNPLLPPAEQFSFFLFPPSFSLNQRKVEHTPSQASRKDLWNFGIPCRAPATTCKRWRFPIGFSGTRHSQRKVSKRMSVIVHDVLSTPEFMMRTYPNHDDPHPFTLILIIILMF